MRTGTPHLLQDWAPGIVSSVVLWSLLTIHKGFLFLCLCCVRVLLVLCTDYNFRCCEAAPPEVNTRGGALASEDWKQRRADKAESWVPPEAQRQRLLERQREQLRISRERKQAEEERQRKREQEAAEQQRKEQADKEFAEFLSFNPGSPFTPASSSSEETVEVDAEPL